jgi:Fe2+ transport system protein FeoA
MTGPGCPGEGRGWRHCHGRGGPSGGNIARLGDAGEGCIVRIKNVQADGRLTKRLCDLGLYPGMKIEVVKNDLNSPVVLKVLESKLMLGREQANDILVETIK